VLTGDVAAVLTWEGHAIGVDRHGGRARWRVELPGGAIAAPVTDGATIVAVWEESRTAGVVALDARTGATRWSRPLPSGGVSGPALVGAAGRSSVVLVAGDRRIHALGLTDGAERWTAPTPGGAGSPEVPPVSDGADVVVADRLTGLARLTSSGEQRWGTPGPGAAVRGGPVALPGGVVALPIDEGGLLLGAGRGRPQLYTTDGRVSGLARTGALLVVATREGERNTLSAFQLVSGA
jgi:outer membrane protein assembly factor BamB